MDIRGKLRRFCGSTTLTASALLLPMGTLLTLGVARPILAAAESPAEETSKPSYRDYASLTHTLKLEAFRAGNHDVQGKLSRYYFQVKLVGYIDSEAEKSLAPDRKKTKLQEVGKFGDIQLSSLSFLPISDKDKQGIHLQVEGDRVRVLVSEMMGAYAASEEDVAVYAEVSLHREQKKYFVWPDDQLIGSITYAPIPFHSAARPLGEDQTLSFDDKVGTHLTMKVTYKKPAS